MSRVGRWTNWLDGIQKITVALRRLTFEENFKKDYIDVASPSDNDLIVYNSTTRIWENQQDYELTDFTTITGDHTATF
jgi:hypothetical protein